MDAYVNRNIKGYELRERVGAGGFGAVYRAYQPSVGREVAIKVILPERANQAEFIRRFEVEAQVITRLEHPHIVPIYDYWRDPEGAFLVMRWLRGSLRGAIRQGAWSPQSAGRLLEQIASALTVAHREGIVHRDIKPDNILLDEDDNAYLADFGIAKNLNAEAVTEEGTLIGSLTYITPEQIKGDPISPKTDIYSLGMVIYELLLGEQPYADVTTAGELISRHLSAPLPRLHPRHPHLPAALDEVLQTATAKNPDQRYANALRFAAEFATSISGAGSAEPLGEALTPRELDILRLMVEGLSNAQIAEKLFLSAGTVKWYVNQLYAKLDVHSRSQAVERARQLQLFAAPAGQREPMPLLERTIVSVLTPPASLPEQTNPYKGLRAFQEADSADFFGRAALTEQLLGRLSASDDGARFLALVGPSGSGKSSAVRAGLIPALRKGALPNSAQWFITEMLPGTHPFEELEAALLRVSASHLPDLHAQLTEDRRGLVRAIKRLLPNDPQVELVLVIDQFEELFTLGADEATRSQFIDSLLAAVSDPRSRMRIVLTLRADFYDRPLRYPRLAELMRSHTEVAIPMTASELERAIAGPAERLGLAFEPGLTTAIINDVFGQPAALPLLQFSLSELYERRQERLLTTGAYQESGGISGALARRADELFDGLDTVGQAAARQVFLRLIAPGEGVEDTRRRVLQTELVSLSDERAIDDLIDLYSQYRLLTLDHDPITRGATVEIAHEALIHAWDRLHQWVEASRDELRLQRRLAVAAGEWVSSERDVSFLAAGARLIQFEALAANGTLTLNETERAYLESSTAERERAALAERERQAHELSLARQSAQAQRRAANRLRSLVGLMIGAVVVASALSAFAISRQRLADQNASLAYDSATQAAVNKERAQSLRLAAEANRLLQTGDSAELTTLLAVRSLEGGYSQQADSALEQAVLLPLPTRVLTSDVGTIGGAYYLPDGTIFTVGSQLDDPDSIARLWDAQTGQVIRRFDEVAKHNVFLSSNGKELMATDGHTVWLYDLPTETEIAHFTDSTRLAVSGDLSPDGRYLLRGDADGTVRMYDVQTGDELRRFDGLANDAIRVRFSPDGKYIFTTPERTIAAMWDAQTGEQLTRFVGHTDAVYPMGISPDGKLLLTASNDSTARLWDIASGQEVRRFVGHTGSVWSAAFSPDGTLILTGGIDRTARLWDAATGEELYRFTGANGPLSGVGFSPDGKAFVTGGDGLFARVWAVPSAQSPYLLQGHTSDIQDVLVSPDGATYITASVDDTARIWDARSGALEHILQTQGRPIDNLLMSPDGKLLLTNTASDESYLWSFPDGNLLQSLPNCCGWGAAISPDFTRFASTGAIDNQPMLTLSDIRDLNSVVQLYAVPVPTSARTLQFSPDGTTILMSGEDKVARLYDAQSGEQLQQFVGHTSTVVSAVFSPDGRTLLTSSFDKTARLWDAASGAEIRRFVGHTANLNDAVFSPDGCYIATASGDGTARLWDVSTGQELRTFVGHKDIVFSVAFTPDGTQLVTGSRDRTARIWDVDYHRLIDAACLLLPRDFTAEERTQFDIADSTPTCPSLGIGGAATETAATSEAEVR